MPLIFRGSPKEAHTAFKSAGDRYAGLWKAGFEDGVGTYLAADGSTYYGSWSGGRLDGPGVYKPVPAGDGRCAARQPKLLSRA